MKKKTFLVTGGTGFIGSNISNLLVNQGHKVKIFDNNSRGSIQKIKDFKKKIKFIKGDVRNKQSLNKALKNTDAVIHLAYVNGTKYFYSKPVLVLDIAIKGIFKSMIFLQISLYLHDVLHDFRMIFARFLHEFI